MIERLNHIAALQGMVHRLGKCYMRCDHREAFAVECPQGLVLSVAFEPPVTAHWLHQITLLLALHDQGLDDGIHWYEQRWWLCRRYAPEVSRQALEQGIILQVALVRFFETQLREVGTPAADTALVPPAHLQRGVFV